MAPEKEERIFKGIRFTHISIIISAGLLLIGLIGIGGKIIVSTTEILVQMKLNTQCTMKATKDVEELRVTEKNDYKELTEKIDKKRDRHYQYLIPPGQN